MIVGEVVGVGIGRGFVVSIDQLDEPANSQNSQNSPQRSRPVWSLDKDLRIAVIIYNETETTTRGTE